MVYHTENYDEADNFISALDFVEMPFAFLVSACIYFCQKCVAAGILTDKKNPFFKQLTRYAVLVSDREIMYFCNYIGKLNSMTEQNAMYGKGIGRKFSHVFFLQLSSR